MPSDRTLSSLQEIAVNLRYAKDFTRGMEYPQFRLDRKTAYAVTRCFEIVSEASRRLPDELKARHPAIPWRDIAGAGNVYRHDYEAVEEWLLWQTLQTEVDRLLEVVDTELSRLSGG